MYTHVKTSPGRNIFRHVYTGRALNLQKKLLKPAENRRKLIQKLHFFINEFLVEIKFALAAARPALVLRLVSNLNGTGLKIISNRQKTGRK